jgi:antitoxin PrlF
MTNKTYTISPAKIGNQDGFRLPRAFSKDYPQLVNASGEVEVLDNNTQLVRLTSQELERNESEEESLVMGLFLDFLMNEAIAEPEKLVAYTEEMSTEIDELLVGVVVE